MRYRRRPIEVQIRIVDRGSYKYYMTKMRVGSNVYEENLNEDEFNALYEPIPDEICGVVTCDYDEEHGHIDRVPCPNPKPCREHS